MDKTSRIADDVHTRRHRSCVIHTLFGWTGRLYTIIGNSVIGRALTGYRHLDGAVGGGRKNRFRLVSRGRMPIADAVKRSRIIALSGGFWRLLYDLPMRFYGLFALMYGAVGAILHFLIPLLVPSFASDDIYLTVALAMMALSLPPLTSHGTLRQSVSCSHVASLILTRCFCIPTDPVTSTEKKVSVAGSAVAVTLAFFASTVAIFISPYLVPFIAAALILCGLIFSYPETGALMSAILLPVVWVLPRVLTLLVGIIILTWMGYGFKLLRLHRMVRYDIADIAVLLLLILCLISCVGGVVTGSGLLVPSIVLFVCLSEYFLIVHLMTTRAYISRCLVCLGLSTVFMTVAFFMLRTDVTDTTWLVGSYGGDIAAQMIHSVQGIMSNVSRNDLVMLSVLLTPFLYAALLRARRSFSRAVVGILLLLNLYHVLSSGSVGAPVCVACTTVLFCLLCDHRTLTVGTLLLPLGAGAVGWYFVWRDPMNAETVERLSAMRYAREVRFSELWQRVLEHPFGWGVSADCEGGNLVLQVLYVMGWEGLVVAAIAIVLLLLKSLTALSHAATFADRTLVVGLFCGVLAGLLRGVTYGFLLNAPALLTVVLFCALGSAFANILFDEHDVKEAESMNAPNGTDRVYRRR